MLRRKKRIPAIPRSWTPSWENTWWAFATAPRGHDEPIEPPRVLTYEETMQTFKDRENVERIRRGDV